MNYTPIKPIAETANDKMTQAQWERFLATVDKLVRERVGKISVGTAWKARTW